MPLADLLDAVVDFLSRFVAFRYRAQVIACALWVAHTFAIDASDNTGYLGVTSAEKRSGKTRLLDVLELLVAKPWRVVLPSEAVLFRKLAANPGTTLLLDELDAVFGPKTAAQHEGIRALLNDGYRRGSKVPRCVGEGSKQRVVDFDCYGAKALAAINELPDTIADRCIHIRLQRRAKSEHVERFRYRDVAPDGDDLRRALADALAPHIETLRAARPELPYELEDRLQDSWEPLLCVADLAGGEWPEAARQAALELAGARPSDEDSLQARLLADIRTVFTDEGSERLFTADLIDALAEIEESPWGDYYGKPISAQGISKLLRGYGIKPHLIRIGEEVKRGYVATAFTDAWNRYLPPLPPEGETPLQALQPAWDWAENPTTEPPVTDVTEKRFPEKTGEGDVERRALRLIQDTFDAETIAEYDR
jgi:hypothetical protein